MRLRLRLLHFSLCSLQTSRNEWERGVGEEACKQARSRISESDPGFFVGGGALLRNGVIDW